MISIKAHKCDTFDLSISPPRVKCVLIPDAPRVNLSMGKNLAHMSIKEGDDVYYVCSIKSNPPHTSIEWRQNVRGIWSVCASYQLYISGFQQGQLVKQNLKGGILLSGVNLVLQRVRRDSAGNYTCSATNELGTATSNSDELTVMCKLESSLSY